MVGTLRNPRALNCPPNYTLQGFHHYFGGIVAIPVVDLFGGNDGLPPTGFH